MALQDGWQKKPMSLLLGSRHREVRDQAQPRKHQENLMGNHRGEAHHGNRRQGGKETK